MTLLQCLCGATVRIPQLRPDRSSWLLFDDPSLRKWGADLRGPLRWRTAAAHHCATGRHLWVLWDGDRGRATVYSRQDAGPSAIGAADAATPLVDRAALLILDTPATACAWTPVSADVAPSDVDLPSWWAVPATVWSPRDPATLDDEPRPVRRCPDGDHLVAWWQGTQAPAAVYVAAGVTRRPLSDSRAR